MGDPQAGEVAGTKVLTSEELIALSNEQIAMRLYFILINGTGKGLIDLAAISNLLYEFARQQIRPKENSGRWD